MRRAFQYFGFTGMVSRLRVTLFYPGGINCRAVGMKLLVLWVIATICGATSVLAHGVRYDIESKRTVCVRVAYDDGEPMSYARTKVFGPENAKTEHQNGRTDKNGRFAFVPDTAGAWMVDVGDGMGHAIQAEIDIVGGDDPVKNSAPARAAGPLPGRAAAGLSVIFFLSGAFFWWKGLRRSRLKPGKDGP